MNELCLRLDQGPTSSPRASRASDFISSILPSSTAEHQHSLSLFADAKVIASIVQMEGIAASNQKRAWVSVFQSEVVKLRELTAGWDSYDSPAPPSVALDAASDFLSKLWDIRPAFGPTRIAPSVDGSVVISFLNDSVRANIEFFSTGETAAMVARKNQEPIVWEVEDEASLVEAIEQISDALEAGQATADVQMGPVTV